MTMDLVLVAEVEAGAERILANGGYSEIEKTGPLKA